MREEKRERKEVKMKKDKETEDPVPGRMSNAQHGKYAVLTQADQPPGSSKHSSSKGKQSSVVEQGVTHRLKQSRKPVVGVEKEPGSGYPSRAAPILFFKKIIGWDALSGLRAKQRLPPEQCRFPGQVAESGGWMWWMAE